MIFRRPRKNPDPTVRFLVPIDPPPRVTPSTPPSEAVTMTWLESQPGYWAGRAAVRAAARRDAARTGDWEAEVHHAALAAALERRAADMPTMAGDEHLLTTQLAPHF